MKSFLKLFDVNSLKPEHVIAQVTQTTRRLPLVYIMLVLNTITVSISHIHIAPAILTIYIPALLCVACAYRIYNLLANSKKIPIYSEAAREWKRTIFLAAALGIAFTSWAFSLYPYGDASTQGQLAFFIAITLIGIVFCLLHIRAAALTLTIGVSIPFFVFFVTTGNFVHTLTALNMSAVVVIMVHVLFTYYEDFIQLQNKHAETQKLSEENHRLAYQDALTLLPNRRQFFQQIQSYFETGQDGRQFVVGVMDLDGFKPVNDVYGHPVGDLVLQQVSERLQAAKKDWIRFFRLGGDEFGIIITADLSDKQIVECGSELCAALQIPFELEEGTIHISASLGFATGSSRYSEDANNVFEQADYALYHAKNSNRGHTVLFSKEHENTIKEYSRVEQALRKADLGKDFSLVFQPIIDIKRGQIYAVEALARWKMPNGSNVPPNIFIEVAERIGVMNDLTCSLLENALKTASTWPGDFRLSFNLSVLDISSPITILRIIRLIREANFDARRITFEVTETLIMKDFDRTIEGLQTLKNLGAKIALDDFGTGFSSLSYLQKIPLNQIKLDRSFITDITESESARNIVGSLISLAHNLGLNVVAEGIETHHQQQEISDLGCDVIQGYYLARPMDAAKLQEFITNNELADLSTRSA